MINIYKLEENGEEKYLNTDVSTKVIQIMSEEYTKIQKSGFGFYSDISFQQFLQSHGIPATYLQFDNFIINTKS
jgi:hypothetical protein